MRLPRLTSLTLPAIVALLASGSAMAQTCPGDDSFEENDSCAATAVLTAGTHSGLALKGAAHATGLDADYFQISVPNGQQLTIDALFLHAAGDIDILLYEGLNCATLTSIGGSATDNETVSATNNTGGTQDYSLWVDPYGSTFDCNDYTLVVTITNDPCVNPVADAYEDNDTCATAQPAAGPAIPSLNVQNGDEDYYIITTQPGVLTFIDVNFIHNNGDLDIKLYDDLACTNQVAISQSVSDNETVSYQNISGSPLDVVLHVYGYGSGFGCNDYDISISTNIDPCSVLAEDANEDNDDCFTATPAPEGTIAAQAVFLGDPDWFRIDLTDGETLTADCLFTHDNGDLDMRLWDGCPGVEIDSSETVSDNEQIIYTNTTGASTSVYIEVYVWQGSIYSCNSYDLDITLDGGVAGVPICFGDGSSAPCPCFNESTVGAGEGCKSSLGYGAVLSVTGSASVAADDISFTVTQARANQPSMLVQGATLIASPFKDGVLCTGNPTERVEVVFTDASGSGTTVGSIVTNGAVSAGVTRYYQQWFRDPGGVSPCGNGSNFSSGVMVVYEP
ncbi:MAG: hypothetical protein H6831_09615 [Planctomycetes bacterium]|nr:hypothetical protein [Planctomycetota bacterium]